MGAERLRYYWHRVMGDEVPEPPEEEPGDQVSYPALELVLRVGELLLASGEATERVNESMLSLAVAYELPRCEVSVTFTGISASAHPGNGAPPVTGFRSVRRRYPAYSRLVSVHALVQDATIGLLDVAQARALLTEIKRRRPPYPHWLMVVSLALVAATASVLVGGTPLVAVTAFAATVLGDRAATELARRGMAEFFQVTVAAAIGTSSAALTVWAGAPTQGAAVVTGAVVALMPGRPLVASIQDGITGDLLSAAARMLEVFFIVAAIVAGVGVSVYVVVRLGAPVNVDDLPHVPLNLNPVTVLAAAGVSVAFALSVAVPRRVLLPSALGGALIWIVYVLVRDLSVPPVLASALAAVLVGLPGNLLARHRREPALPYVVPAIAPLLPGTALYRGLLEMNTATPINGVLSLFEALSIALALAAGVNLGGELVRALHRGGLGGSGRSRRPAARRTRGY